MRDESFPSAVPPALAVNGSAQIDNGMTRRRPTGPKQAVQPEAPERTSAGSAGQGLQSRPRLPGRPSGPPTPLLHRAGKYFKWII